MQRNKKTVYKTTCRTSFGEEGYEECNRKIDAIQKNKDVNDFAITSVVVRFV